MDKEAVEILAYVRENASDLKKLGKSWGLTDSEISQCIEQAMLMKPEDLPPPSKETIKKLSAPQSWRKLKICLLVAGTVMLLLGGSSLMSEIQLPSITVFEPYLVELSMVLRKLIAALKVHSLFDVYGLSEAECIVNNPFFDETSFLGDHVCENCDGITAATVFKDTEGVLPETVFSDPVLVKGRGRNVSFETFQDIIRGCPGVLKQVPGTQTNLEWAPQVRDLLEEGVEEKLKAHPDFYFFWDSKGVATNHVLRKVFPRPSFFPPTTDVEMNKILYITGPKAKEYHFKGGSYLALSWYSQGWGSTELELTPTSRCPMCATFKVLLVAGDVFTFNNKVYTLKIKPAGEESINVGFLCHFAPWVASEEPFN